MIRSTIELSATPEDQHLARMAAFAIGLSLIDAMLPMPVPGIKPGLANIVVLLVLARFGIRAAIWVSMLRVVAGALLFGSFLSPGFFLSLAGAASSLAALYFASRLPGAWFGAVSHSLFASVAHIGGQLLLAYFWLIPNIGLARLIPLFLLSAILFGLVNGLIAARVAAEKNVEGGVGLQIQCCNGEKRRIHG